MSDSETEDTLGLVPKKREKVWKLKGGTMVVKYVGYKKRGDHEMIVELSFTFDGEESNPRIVELAYNNESIKNSQIICENSLEKLLELRDCSFRDMTKEFPIFVLQELNNYKQNRQDTAGTVQRKVTKEYTSPQIDRFDGTLYFIADNIYRLNNRNKDPTLAYVDQLTPEEVNTLPVKILYSGPNHEFECNEEAFARIYTDILRDFMSMQAKEFVSFPLAATVQHLSGEFYPFIIEDHGNFCVQMVCSGSSTGTGKSLMQTILMRSIKGGDIHPTKSCTESEAYVILGRGEHIYVKEFSDTVESARCNDFDLKLLKKMIQALWERSRKKVMGKEYTPSAVIYIDANSGPDRIVPHLGHATATKLMFLATGEQPLEHDEQMVLVQRILKNATKLHKYLPIFLGVARSSVMDRVTDPELKDLSGVLRVAGDIRQGQLVRNYDRFYNCIQEMILKYVIDPPELFVTKEIDRTALLHYNSDRKVKEETATTAKMLLREARSDTKYAELVDYSERTAMFRIKVADLTNFPNDVEKALRNLKINRSGIFKGQKARIVEIPERLLSAKTASGLKGLGLRYILYLTESLKNLEQQEQAYGEEFCKEMSTAGRESNPEVIRCEKTDCKHYGYEFNADDYQKHIRLMFHVKGTKSRVKSTRGGSKIPKSGK